MRRALSLFTSLAVGLTFAAVAHATTNEPNGLQVPLDSANGEEQLYTMFQSLGDPVDWQADAATTPNAFSPLCGFTATFVLNQAGSHFGLAWYNDNGSAPPASDLHVIMPPNSPVGTQINGANIKADPAYQGGLVGFALVGGQTHYSNPAYDPVCTVCSPPGPWITAVIYPSKNTPSAFYIAFEDGSVNAFGFSNDGDFNDDVFFLTGLTCSGGGQPCDTGQPGVCSNGVTECTQSGTDCKPLVAPGTETCNGLDDDCNGIVDDNAPCQAGYVCDKGSCVQACNGGEFTCTGGLVCSMDGYCVDPSCANVTCPSGQVCGQGVCKGPCDGIVCPYGQACRVGTCTDPCNGVTCGMGEVCLNGGCVNTCPCTPCANGQGCDMASGKCVESACVGATCPTGSHCEAGACQDDCMGAMCPGGGACVMGVCQAPMTATGSGGASGSGSSSSGIFVGTGGASDSSGASMGNSSGAGNGVDGDDSVGPNKGGCGCRMAGDAGGASALAIAIAALGIATSRRRRSSREKGARRA